MIQDFKIEIKDELAPHALNLVGIESPGLTAAVPIARYAIELMKERETLEENPDFNPVRKGIRHFAQCTKEEQAELIKENPDYGEVICRCEKVTKAEILQAIHNPLGVDTMTGVKYRTRSMMGRCQGGYCQMRIVNMLQFLGDNGVKMRIEQLIEQELGKKETEVQYEREGSNVLFGKVREV